MNKDCSNEHNIAQLNKKIVKMKIIVKINKKQLK